MPKSCPTEPVAGCPRDKEKQRETRKVTERWSMEKKKNKKEARKGKTNKNML